MTGRDRADFAEFVAARSPALQRAAYLMVGDVAMAQDLVQEALTKTYVAWPRLRDKGNAATRQLAKRQLTWLRSMPDRIVIDCLAPEPAPAERIMAEIARYERTDG